MKFRLRVELGKADLNKETGNYKYHICNVDPKEMRSLSEFQTQQNKFTNPGNENDLEWTKNVSLNAKPVLPDELFEMMTVLIWVLCLYFSSLHDWIHRTHM